MKTRKPKPAVYYCLYRGSLCILEVRDHTLFIWAHESLKGLSQPLVTVYDLGKQDVS